MCNRRITGAALVAAALPLTFAAPLAGQSLEDRLERIVEALEAARVEHHVPGMAIAIVRDDAIVLSRGFGLADVESGTPATDETRFAAGSTTKALTAAVMGMLVDEGRMGWDDRVRDHLPGFRLADAGADERVTLRDLLCHRVGLASMNLLWYGTGVTAAEVLEPVGRAELLHPFREKFNYSNVSFLAAGEATARAAGTSWASLVEERIFGPLGMRDSNLSIEAAGRDPGMATGYRWDEAAGELEATPLRDVGPVAPAGALNSSVRDMARWVRFQLGRGAFEGRRLLSEAQHEQTWTKHVSVQGEVDYGLGWMLHARDGRRVIEHAGGIDGFTAEVAMLPDEGIGFVLLMNLFASPLQSSAPAIVFDGLLGPWSDDAEPPGPAEDFDRYVGTYVGDFGPFDEADFEVLVRHGRLAVDVPGQTVYELEAPGADGRRQFVITDQIAVKFSAGDDGAVYSMSIFQGGMTFELPRKGVEMPVEIDLEAARRYLGVYHTENLGVDVEIEFRNNRLAVDVPGQMVYELHAPDAEGRWVLRATDTMWLRFDEDGAGAIASLTFTQDGVEEVLPRVGDASTAAPPTVDEIMALVRKGQGSPDPGALAAWRATGTARFVHAGVSGPVELVVTADSSRETIDLGRYGSYRVVLEGDRGWSDMPAERDADLEGERLEQLRLEHPAVWRGDWRESFEQVRVRGRERFEGREVCAVRLKPALGPWRTAYVDVEDGTLLGQRVTLIGALGARVEATYRYGDYRAVEGVMVPFRVESENPVTGRIVVEFEEVGGSLGS